MYMKYSLSLVAYQQAPNLQPYIDAFTLEEQM